MSCRCLRFSGCCEEVRSQSVDCVRDHIQARPGELQGSLKIASTRKVQMFGRVERRAPSIPDMIRCKQWHSSISDRILVFSLESLHRAACYLGQVSVMVGRKLVSVSAVLVKLFQPGCLPVRCWGNLGSILVSDNIGNQIPARHLFSDMSMSILVALCMLLKETWKLQARYSHQPLLFDEAQ